MATPHLAMSSAFQNELGPQDPLQKTLILKLRGRSSIGQSRGLIILWFPVRVWAALFNESHHCLFERKSLAASATGPRNNTAAAQSSIRQKPPPPEIQKTGC